MSDDHAQPLHEGSWAQMYINPGPRGSKTASILITEYRSRAEVDLTSDQIREIAKQLLAYAEHLEGEPKP